MAAGAATETAAAPAAPAEPADAAAGELGAGHDGEDDGAGLDGAGKDSVLRGSLVYSLGGALLLALREKSVSDLPRREIDGSLVVERGEILKSFLVPGKAVRLRRQGARNAEAQYRWNCPQYKDCPVGYQLRSWDETESKIFLFDEMVFASADAAVDEVVRTAPKVVVPPCFKFESGHLRVAVKPVFGTTGTPFAEYQEESRFLALGVPCSAEDPEDVRSGSIIAVAAQHVFALPEHQVRLDWDPRVDGLVLVVKSRQTAKLHLAVERNLARLREFSSSSSSSSAPA